VVVPASSRRQPRRMPDRATRRTEATRGTWGPSVMPLPTRTGAPESAATAGTTASRFSGSRWSSPWWQEVRRPSSGSRRSRWSPSRASSRSWPRRMRSEASPRHQPGTHPARPTAHSWSSTRWRHPPLWPPAQGLCSPRHSLPAAERR